MICLVSGVICLGVLWYAITEVAGESVVHLFEDMHLCINSCSSHSLAVLRPWLLEQPARVRLVHQSIISILHLPLGKLNGFGYLLASGVSIQVSSWLRFYLYTLVFFVILCYHGPADPLVPDCSRV